MWKRLKPEGARVIALGSSDDDVLKFEAHDMIEFSPKSMNYYLP
jgi:hypothetical protein